MYIVDMDVQKLVSLEPRTEDFISMLDPRVGLVEHMPSTKISGDLINVIHDCRRIPEGTVSRGSRHNTYSLSGGSDTYATATKPKVAVVGSGPSGLFASLVLAELGANVTLIERGQPVEQRGRDIGALVVRRMLQTESNFCFGEVILLTQFIFYCFGRINIPQLNYCAISLFNLMIFMILNPMVFWPIDPTDEFYYEMVVTMHIAFHILKILVI